MIQIPVLGAFIEAAGTTIEKKILKNKKLSSNTYTTLSFLSIVAIMIPFVYFFWSVKTGAFSGWNLFLLSAICIFSVGANLLSYYALKGEKIIDFEPIWLTQPLFTIVLAFFVYGSQGNNSVLYLALIASITLIAAHIRKSHLNFDKYAVALLLGNLFYAVELVCSQEILKSISPFTLYFIRCSFILFILLLFIRPKTNGVNKKTGWLIFFVGILWVIYRMILYYGYIAYGIFFTTTLFTLAPVLLLVMAKVFLKEKMTIRQVIATIIILACVVSAIYLNG